MKLSIPSESNIINVLRLWYLVGIVGFSLPVSHELFRSLTPLSLLLLASVFFVYHENRDKRLLWVMVFIFVAGYAIEVVGVKTGKIFGVYTYGKALGIKVAEVPLIIGLNWVIMVYGSLAIATLTGLGRVLASLLAAVIMTSSDVFIEKFAILSDMWSWQNTEPPLQNYLSWLIFSFIFCLIAYPSIAGKTRKVAIHGYVYQLALFLLILLIHRLFWP
jgi:putative membrane protein